ncbi:hypothetical protein HS7_17910 [Sulfolobales archaeon HS-7]|nr:hypothetical protein HS7_17910 [Sulfolobales archaeon HS-7]
MTSKMRCMTCGRFFPEGQGVSLKIGDDSLLFHSNSCAFKFVREVLLEVDRECITGPLEDTKKRFNEKIKLLDEKKQKKI